MIEQEIGPFDLRVTDFAFFPQFAFVRFVLLVAVVTLRRRFTMFLLRFMAGTARDEAMRGLEWKICLVMIEGTFVQQNDLEIATFMIGMAGLALTGLDVAHFSMESFLLVHISANFLVTVQAQTVVLFLGERGMALFAIFFVFRMALNQRPGHGREIQSGNTFTGERKKAHPGEQDDPPGFGAMRSIGHDDSIVRIFYCGTSPHFSPRSAAATYVAAADRGEKCGSTRGIHVNIPDVDNP